MSRDPQVLAHQEWIGYVQPVGLVVSIPALLNAQAVVDRSIIPRHQKFLEQIALEPTPAIVDFPTFVQSVLEWRESDLIGRPGGEPLPASLEIALPEYGETLRPTYALREDCPADPANPWLMLIQELPLGKDMDANAAEHDRHWQASPQARMERLLRETEVPIGLLVNGHQIRLVYAPRGESSGHATFKIAEMVTVAGRPIFAALHMLLCADRIFTEAPDRRLPALLANSRKYQAHVSTQLAEQVLAALYEMLRGFQAANDVRNGDLLRDVLKEDPNQVYNALLTVLMRLVFVLYAEDRDLLSSDPVYTNHYAITGLFDRLRADAGRYPDTMDQRYGAWSQLLTLFRLLHDGGGHGNFRLPARAGYLFNPDRYPFLEGRAWRSVRRAGQRFDVPRVPDGVIYRVLSNLLILDGERLSYRTLDVEQIGSVYEVMMGFGLGIAQGPTIAVKPKKRLGAPTPINLEELLDQSAGDRGKWLKAKSDQELTGEAAAALKSADTIEALLAALDRRIARTATPNVVPKGAMIPIPSDERRRSGSNYTPRSLTEPIVRKTLEPILKRLGEHPTPDELLDLKVCDPAMGSGAFLVEACRQLGDQLVKAWHHHKCLPKIPPDEDELLYARRLIAQRCLYGVDKNPMAADLAKLSMWLATLAREHAFTFLDHSFRAGDSLVGLTRRQIEEFTWEQPAGKQRNLFFAAALSQRIDAALSARRAILDCGDEHYCLALKHQKLEHADERLDMARFIGDLAVAAFFAADKDKKRKEKREEYLGRLTSYLQSGDFRQRPSDAVQALKAGDKGVTPFHWEIEFPEVFGREIPGFDAMVGNPPFAGRITLYESTREGYLEWLRATCPASHGNADLVAFFFRRVFALLRSTGCFGLIATNTISQGDSRSTGLRWIVRNGGDIYAARRRMTWPGEAAVVVSVIHVSKDEAVSPIELDGKLVNKITAYLFHAGTSDDPQRLMSSSDVAFQGPVLAGIGFTFDDEDSTGKASTTTEMRDLLRRHPSCAQRVFPFIGGHEILNEPQHLPTRFVIDFEDMELEIIEEKWPALLQVLREKVMPDREERGQTGSKAKQSRAETWWRFSALAKDLRVAKATLPRVLAHPFPSNHLAFAHITTDVVVSAPHVSVALAQFSAFCSLQSRVHEVWARFFGSSFKDDLRYTPTDCFETFPFPENFETDPRLETVGKAYYEFRAELMIGNNEGLTKTYNRFHDPHETSPGILKLRELHAAMDRAVLDAYGWTDIPTTCEFLLDYEEDDEDDDPLAPGGSRSGKRRKKKPWRYRWPDPIRDEVLARLLALNAERAAVEAEAARARMEIQPKRSRKRQSGSLGKDDETGLFTTPPARK